MTPTDLASDTFYYVAHFEPRKTTGVLPTPVAYPRRFVAVTRGWKGVQDVYVFIDERDVPHRAYGVDLLRYHATEGEALVAAAGELQTMLTGVWGRIGVLESVSAA